MGEEANSTYECRKKRIIQEVKKELTCEAITLFTKLMDGDTTQQKAEYNDA